MRNEKGYLIVKKIKRLREIWKFALKRNANCNEVGVEEARYNYYLEGLSDAFGLAKAARLVKLSKEDV